MRRPATCLIAAALLMFLAGCASGDDASTEPTAPGTAAASDTAPMPVQSSSEEAEKAVEVSVSVSDGRVTPKPRRIEVDTDSQVRLLVTSDVDDEVHVHGYEVEGELEAGRTTTIEFVADQAGVFEVETHESELALLQLEVR